ncbi:hypothetical protein YPPY66_0744 [Yersinia pestis PY-66]|uniref:Uncharacterized protein n=1 Tax=Yersinia pestis biovar Orientalis str. IP275 TaxID=373665 RepID=A0AAV3BEJ0_YERPE|nr:hypothetical protein YpAngola_A0781 [Yersinia pestis Angola]EDR32815.1 hypothetical protein YPIP275_2607 [Yersinia pestis biovar Orientalis str. IP275]EDR38014.1 hypothetical protein YpF1991016_1868 [Yersinia pestis biovar Orientalis str. F1991016]EDR44615.1 hypothetical protein YpE1979001_3110 [Yersinia pestis biovar Antiqua str. E1979001]EDR51459.1 hypothetical protein YpB42003004_4227 [Yersinia pestis biovar Antiqua str. B42003004]EDR56106.1 hypothetical protein YpMG051020_3860 [Yersinia
MLAIRIKIINFNELNHIGDVAARCTVASSQKDIKTKSRHC